MTLASLAVLAENNNDKGSSQTSIWILGENAQAPAEWGATYDLVFGETPAGLMIHYYNGKLQKMFADNSFLFLLCLQSPAAPLTALLPCSIGSGLSPLQFCLDNGAGNNTSLYYLLYQALPTPVELRKHNGIQ